MADVLNCRHRTNNVDEVVGVHETGRTIRFIDCPGQRDKFDKWRLIHKFDTISACMFVLSVAGFDRTLSAAGDNEVNIDFKDNEKLQYYYYYYCCCCCNCCYYLRIPSRACFFSCKILRNSGVLLNSTSDILRISKSSSKAPSFSLVCNSRRIHATMVAQLSRMTVAYSLSSCGVSGSPNFRRSCFSTVDSPLTAGPPGSIFPLGLPPLRRGRARARACAGA